MKTLADIVPDAERFDRQIGTAMAYAVSHTVTVITAKMRNEHRWKDVTGATRKTIQGTYLATKLGATGHIRAGANAILLNDGTRPHRIEARNGKALRFTSGGQTIFRRGVNHPGTAPDPFLTAAEDAAADELFDTFDEMFSGLE